METEPGTTDVIEVSHDDDHVHIGTVVVEALSEATDTEISQMDIELNSVIDPDALETLFAPRPDGTPRQGGSIVFELMGRTVHVETGDETIVSVE